jgi:RNA polymerase sigma factor (sigma-70 family)
MPIRAYQELFLTGVFRLPAFADKLVPHSRSPPCPNRFLDFSKRLEERHMQNWQKERNYRKFENEDGSVIHIITVDGEDIEVSAEVYKVYAQADRRERYQAERDTGRLLSLERMDEDAVLLSYLTDEQIPSVEDEVLRQMDAEELATALDTLTPEERRLIEALIQEGVTERDYAARIGMSQKGVNKRRQKILQKIFDFLVLKQPGFREGK